MAKNRTPKDKSANTDSRTFLDEEIDLQEQYGKAEAFINSNKNKLFKNKRDLLYKYSTYCIFM